MIPKILKEQTAAILEAADLLGMPIMTVSTPGTCSAKLTEVTSVVLKATLSVEPHVKNISATSLIRPHQPDCDAYLRSRALLKCCRLAREDGCELKPGMSNTMSGVEGYSRDNKDRMDSDTATLSNDREIQKIFSSKACISPSDVVDSLQEAIRNVHSKFWFDCSTQT